MKIAITGAGGDIGGTFLAHRAPQDKCHALARRNGQHPAFTHPNVTPFTFKDGFVYSTDMLDAFLGVDSVVHTAALLNIVADPAVQLVDYLAVNALFTGLLAARCAHRGIHLVYISTEMVYDLEDTVALRTLIRRFSKFCARHFSNDTAIGTKSYDLRTLARQFIAENPSFPFIETNIYALTKYLGEAVVRAVPGAAIVRVACAYGPEYSNPRLIPRLAAGRLSGDGATFVVEDRNFVYSADINALLSTTLENRLCGTIDCRPQQSVNTEKLKQLILQSTPTAYGALKGIPGTKQKLIQTIEPATLNLTDVIGGTTPFRRGLAATLRVHKDKCYRQMKNNYTPEDFLKPGEHVAKVLVGNSASYTYVVATNTTRAVRKIAIREGVEGNGVAKLTNEVRFYRHAMQDPALKRFYPQLLDSVIDPAFATETIEYLEGPNVYAALKDGRRPFSYYRRCFTRFIHALCDTTLKESEAMPITDPLQSLNAYYLERPLSRLQSIRPIVPATDTIRINGRQLLSPHIILAELMRNPALHDVLLPHVEYPCFHGDMTLLNAILLTKTQEIKLVDPRGVTGLWDPLYDFAKLKFTLSGFGELILEPEPLITLENTGYYIHFETIPPYVQRLHEEFFAILEAEPLFIQKIATHEPHWRTRIALADAVHHVSDIPFRLFTDDTDWKAISLYILGTYYLNELYESLRQGIN